MDAEEFERRMRANGENPFDLIRENGGNVPPVPQAIQDELEDALPGIDAAIEHLMHLTTAAMGNIQMPEEEFWGHVNAIGETREIVEAIIFALAGMMGDNIRISLRESGHQHTDVGMAFLNEDGSVGGENVPGWRMRAHQIVTAAVNDDFPTMVPLVQTACEDAAFAQRTFLSMLTMLHAQSNNGIPIAHVNASITIPDGLEIP